MPYLLVITSVPTIQEARRLSKLFLQRKLAACIQISPSVEAHYRWNSKNVKSREYQLWIKTKTSLFPKLEKTILKEHAYDVPEIIGIPIFKGNRNYLSWISAELD